MKNKGNIILFLSILLTLTFSYSINFTNTPSFQTENPNKPILNIHSSPPSFQASTMISSSSDITSFNFSHATPPGENRILIVIVGLEGDLSVNSCLYGGTDLTPIIRGASEAAAGCSVEMWYLINPPVGNYTVLINFPAENPSYAVALSYQGIDQDDPIGAVAHLYASSGTDVSVNINTTLPNSIIIGGAESHGSDTAPFTPNIGVIERYNYATGPNAENDAGCWGGEIAAENAQEYHFGAKSAASDDWTIVAVEFKAYDKTPPFYSNLFESADPLELGNTEIISVNLSDFTGIKSALIEYEGTNHTMKNIAKNKWQDESWSPKRTGLFPYVIWMRDVHNNWNFTSGTINVIDTTPPNPPQLLNYPHNEISGSIIFSWDDGHDPSGIAYYRLIIVRESEPNNNPDYLLDLNISNTGPASCYYMLESLPPGIYYYFLYQFDGTGHQSNCTTGSFTVISVNNNIDWIIPLSLTVVGAVLSMAVGIKIKMKAKPKNIKNPVPVKNTQSFQEIPLEIIQTHVNKILNAPFISEHASKDSNRLLNSPNKFYNELQNLIIRDLEQKRAGLERKARFLEENHLFTSSVLYYRDCENISLQLVKLGKVEEELNVKKFGYKRNELNNKIGGEK